MMFRKWLRRIRKAPVYMACFTFLVCLPMVVNACPFCGTQTSLEIRESIFGKDFLRHAAWTLAPAPVLLGSVAVVYFRSPAKRAKKKGSP